jgi:capsular polysaccharide biosynthesis protein
VANQKQLGIYLDDGLRRDVSNGRHNFFGILIRAFEGRGFKVTLRPNTEEERLESEARDGYSLFHLETPFHDRALDVRLAYMYPFWRIEGVQWREDYRVAQKAFDPTEINEEEARKFTRFWRKKLLSNMGAASKHGSHVLVALQGRLQDQRHGQAMSPIAMIREVLAQDRFRQIVIKLHPKEPYTNQELAALEEFESNPRVEFGNGDIHTLIADCDYIVTQNSSTAFKGLLQNTPAVLFGESDFHHILESVNRDGAARAFRNIQSKRMPYAKYFYWFLQMNMINAGRDGAAEKILNNCRELGWDV